jgi:GntR family transcriptional regulator, rspAB operon transcriptional repressor
VSNAVSFSDNGNFEAMAKARESRPLSKTNQVYFHLRNDIATLVLAPGTFIDKSAVCDALKVSRFPVADALARLAREKLVDVEPQRGSFVAQIRHQDVDEALFLRTAIEEKSVRVLSVPKLKDLSKAMMLEIEMQHAAVAARDLAAFMASDERFHLLIVQSSGNQRAVDLVLASRAHSDRMRRHTVMPERWRKAIEEHLLVAQAAGAGDAEAAGRALADHFAVIREGITVAGD